MYRFAFLLAGLLLAPRAASAVEPAELVGTWNVTLEAEFSSCRDVTQVGDIKAQQWVVSFSGGKLVVEVLAAGGTSSSYEGLVLKDGDGANTDEVQLAASRTGHRADVELEVDGQSMTGRRVVANSTPCAIIYSVKAEKQ